MVSRMVLIVEAGEKERTTGFKGGNWTWQLDINEGM